MPGLYSDDDEEESSEEHDVAEVIISVPFHRFLWRNVHVRLEEYCMRTSRLSQWKPCCTIMPLSSISLSSFAKIFSSILF